MFAPRSLPLAKTVCFVITSAMIAGCGKSKPGATAAEASSGQATASAAITPTSASTSVQAAPKPVDPVVVLHTTAGDVTLKLFAEKSPRTVENFLRGYAERGFYDQTIFHHVEPGRMLIAGGYAADLQRKPTRAPIYNESRNGLANRRGTVAMIREPEAPHSATSEFFINLADNADFDFKSSDADDELGYCVFGEVTSGLDIVDRIAKLPTSAHGDFPQIPSPPVAISSIERMQ